LPPAPRRGALARASADQRVHDLAGIVEPHDPLGRHRSRVTVDAHRDDEGARAPDLALGAEESRRLEPRLGAGRQPLAAIGELGHARPGHAASGRADDAEATVDRDDVLWRRLEEAGRERARLLANLARRPAEPRGLDVRRDADADHLAAGASRRLGAPEPRVVGERERAIQELRVVSRVVDLARRGLEWEPLLRDEIPSAQLDRIDPERARG